MARCCVDGRSSTIAWQRDWRNRPPGAEVGSVRGERRCTDRVPSCGDPKSRWATDHGPLSDLFGPWSWFSLSGSESSRDGITMWRGSGIGAQRSMARPVTRGACISNFQWQCQRKYPGEKGKGKIPLDVRPLGGAVEVCRSQVLDGIEGPPDWTGCG